jgi:hypothetical protein
MQGARRILGLGGLAALVLACAPAAARAEDPPPPASSVAPSASDAPHQTEMVNLGAGPALQVVFGDRAVFHLDEKGAPVLDTVEKGPLALAHPAGAVKEAFEAPGAGKLAVALDGSAEKQASYLKIWNGLDHPVLYHAGILAYVGGKLTPMTVKVCAAPAGGTSDQTWPMPVAAVAVANFTAAAGDNTCQ